MLRILRGFGFEVVAIRGSHAKLRRQLAGARTDTLVVPLHRSLPVGTLAAIYRQAARFVPEAELRKQFYVESA